jgi:K+-transporting ATPase ATPase B chain
MTAPGGGFRDDNARKRRQLFDPQIVRQAMVESFRKLDPRHQILNPVMFVVAVGVC